MKHLFIFILILTCCLNGVLFAQDIPLVYDVEHTGDTCEAPILPPVDELLVDEQLPDPLEWSDGSGRVTSFSSWVSRRAEIKAEIEQYEIGLKPSFYDELTASYANGVLTVNVTQNGETLTLTSNVTLPEGDGPFPAIFAMDMMSVPSTIFSDRDIAIINFTSSQVMAHTQSRGKEPINKLYPDLTNIGAYAAWPWGVSRLIDGLELVQDDLPIDLKHLAVTGCSYAGKMALWSGALDERIALTIAQEPGGGGAAAWRVSETLGEVETLGATNSAWFKQDFKSNFSGSKVSKLPFDNHELVAMCVPRACLILGNSSQVWLAEEAGYVSCRAAQDIYRTFGIKDRFGFVIDTGHGHCASSDEQNEAVTEFVKRFLLDDTTANTGWEINTFPNVEYLDWFEKWGGVPGAPRAKAGDDQNVVDEDNDGLEYVTLDASESFDKDGTIVSYKWSKLGTEIASGVIATVSCTIGLHEITLTVTDDSAKFATDEVKITVNPVQSPYEGTAYEVPCKIEAENFDNGGNGFAYYDDSPGSATGVDFRPEVDVDFENCTDTDGGYSIGYWTAGEWLEYTINVAVADTFDIDLRVANDGGNKTVDIEIDEELVADDFIVESTGGWQTWKTATVHKVILDAGEHVMRITMGKTNYINFNYLEIKPYVPVTDPVSKDDENTQGVILYPNPAKSSVTIEHNTEAYQVVLMNSLGQEVFVSNSQSKFYAIDLQNYNEGVYFVKVTDKFNNEKVMKLVKH